MNARLGPRIPRAALRRGAIAPLWEVKTAKLQAEGGQVDAGLSEEERAAKAGYAAARVLLYKDPYESSSTTRILYII